tara:strand:+ start:56 stop:334 length:279 start_codon:yes stop_codon:yes gene_type:complete
MTTTHRKRISEFNFTIYDERERERERERIILFSNIPPSCWQQQEAVASPLSNTYDVCVKTNQNSTWIPFSQESLYILKTHNHIGHIHIESVR